MYISGNEGETGVRFSSIYTHLIDNSPSPLGVDLQVLGFQILLSLCIRHYVYIFFSTCFNSSNDMIFFFQLPDILYCTMLSVKDAHAAISFSLSLPLLFPILFQHRELGTTQSTIQYRIMMIMNLDKTIKLLLFDTSCDGK